MGCTNSKETSQPIKTTVQQPIKEGQKKVSSFRTKGYKIKTVVETKSLKKTKRNRRPTSEFLKLLKANMAGKDQVVSLKISILEELTGVLGLQE
jgi:hypothetical protein